MAKKIIKAQMKQRQDTKANWAAANPVLLDGELGMVSDDRNLYKVGDGRTAWNDLPFRGFDGTLAQELGTSTNAAISQKAVTEKLTELSWEKGNVNGNNGTEEPEPYVSRTPYIACKKGDVISGPKYRIKLFDKKLSFLTEIIPSGEDTAPIDYVIENNEVAYIRIVTRNEYIGGGLYINGASLVYSCLNEIPKELLRQKKELDIVQGEVGTIEIPFNGKEYANYDYSFVKGQTISEIIGTTGIYLIYADNSNTLILKEQLPYVIDREDAVKFSPITAGEGKLIVKGTIHSMIGGYDEAFFSQGYWLIHSATQDFQYAHTCQFPCKEGDVIKGNFKDVRFFAEKRNYIGNASYNAEGVVIDNADVKYAVINVYRGEANIKTLQINGIPIIAYIANAYFNKDSISASYPYAPYKLQYDVYEELWGPTRMRSNMGACILGLWIKGNRDSEYYLTGFRYRQQTADWGNTEYTQIVITEKKNDNSIVYHQIVNDLTSEQINDDIQVFDSDAFKLIIDWRLATKGAGDACALLDILKLDSITFNKNNTIYLLNYDNIRSGETQHLDSNPYIAIPIPKLAIVNIVADYLPTTKTDDIRAKIEFNDMQGNSFVKNVIANKQGTSTLGLEKGNLSIDVMDENYDDSHEIKFGNWVAQDGYHLKSYYWDGIKVKALAAYDFYENILLSRPCRSNRQWKRMQLPTDIPITGNDINDLYLRIDDGAKCHPSGFPIILYHNGVFFGIYCWQLKKHRKNYHQKKDKAGHIHLDGNISAPLLWEANGNIDWDKWAGKEYESADSDNKEGIEIRNPKKLILVDGSEYDGETNAGELISASSPNYNPNNADMVRTASVRASIEAFSRNATEIINMQKGAARKAKIAEVFDVDSVIDKILFGQVIGDRDGYKKNWQWFTYDGVKWAVAAYDLDGCWGWDSWYYFEPWDSLFDYNSPIIRPIAEEYAEELRERYKYLRDTGVISVSAIMKPLVHYVQTIGNEYYELEDERWTDGEKDNLWRFETWIEESIKLQDAWLGYTSNL